MLDAADVLVEGAESEVVGGDDMCTRAQGRSPLTDLQGKQGEGSKIKPCGASAAGGKNKRASGRAPDLGQGRRRARKDRGMYFRAGVRVMMPGLGLRRLSCRSRCYFGRTPPPAGLPATAVLAYLKASGSKPSPIVY
jgi:hypothetical protein